jgi:putative hydrolase of the HAD superfamily
MNKPKMILFDYGGTLMSEPDFDPESGNAAIFRIYT